MDKNLKRILFVLSIAGITIIIGYLELQKPKISNSPGIEIILPEIEPATSTIQNMVQSESAVPGLAGSLQGTEQVVSTTQAVLQNRSAIRKEKALKYYRAKELADIQGYINTPSFKLADLVGKKVILVDFWTYSCINCIRTFPYLNAWYQKYKDIGLVIVGVHTPEFAFEKNYDNVLGATQQYYIKYPVVLDNNYGTWNAYNNSYWPREYLIDIDGFIIHDKIGEGNYDETEKAIQSALQERQTAFGLDQAIDTSIVAPNDLIPMNTFRVNSPETYFGASRNEYLDNGEQGTYDMQTLFIPQSIKSNKLYLGGTWVFFGEFAQNTSTTSEIVYKYDAKNVYLVASSNNGVKIKVLKDGKELGAEAGADVAQDGTILIKDERLYKLINGSDYGEHTLQIEIQEPGLKVYTFTFG